MSSLRANAGREEIEDEMTFVQVSMDTIDRDADDAAATQHDLELQMQDLERRLFALDNSTGVDRVVRPETPEITVSGSFDDVNLPSRERERRPYGNNSLGMCSSGTRSFTSCFTNNACGSERFASRHSFR